MDRERIERQLKQTQQELAAWESQLDKQKVAAEARPKNTKWRKLDADRRAVVRRLNAVKAVEEREAAALERKAQKSSGEVVDASAE